MQVKYKDDKKSHMVLIEKIPMPNGLTVEVWDKSVSIADDTTKVELLIRIRIELQPSYFAKSDHYERVRKIMGTEIFFEYRKERAFVRDREKNVVSKSCWMISRRTLCHIFREPHFLQVTLFPNTGISRKTATNTVPSSGTVRPDGPLEKARLPLKHYLRRRLYSMVL